MLRTDSICSVKSYDSSDLALPPLHTEKFGKLKKIFELVMSFRTQITDADT